MLVTFLTIILITIDYLRKYNTDRFQRKLMIAILAFILISAMLEFTSRIIPVMELRTTTAMYCIMSIYLITRNAGFYLCAVFISYFTNANMARTKKLLYIVCVIIALNIISVILNLFFGYFFIISPENMFIRTKLYSIHLGINYLPIAIIIYDVLFTSKHILNIRTFLSIIFIIVASASAAIDIIFVETFFFWPCFSAAMLYIYFFIIRTDSKIDSLTGMGNRYSFNELIDRLSRQNIKEKYTVAILDLDRFKEINDNLGHLEGDNALRDMALIIKSCIRKTDIAARFGGDEFVLAAKAGKDEIIHIIDRIQKTIDSQNQMRKRPYQLYMSYGYDEYITGPKGDGHASQGGCGRTIQEFISHVDNLMYKHKESRRADMKTSITAKL